MISTKRSPAFERLAAGLLLAAALALVIWFFERLPIENTTLAFDWRGLWAGIRGGQLRYGDVRNPPWTVLVMMPLGWLPFRASWGVLILLTLLIEVVSVPRVAGPWLRRLAVLLLCASYPSLRNIADGNLEGFVIAGVMLALAGWEQNRFWVLLAGLLLAPIKFQENWLLLLALGYYILRRWPARRWAALAGAGALVVVPTLVWKGRDWWLAATGIPERGSIMDNSLLAAGGRLSAPGWLSAAAWLAVAAAAVWLIVRTSPTLSREKAGLLIAASLLLSPYSSGNSFLTLLAIGIIPIFLTRPIPGLALLALADLPYFFSAGFAFNYSAYYWTAMLLLSFGVCALLVWRAEGRPPRQPDASAAPV